jgi:hypothetical protein
MWLTYELVASMVQLAASQSKCLATALGMLHVVHMVAQRHSWYDTVYSVAGSLLADDPGTPYSRRSDKSSSEPGDVELIERNTNDSSAYGEQHSTCTAAV